MDTSQKEHKNVAHFSFDMRIICIVLILIIAGMFIIWKPWSTPKGDRTIEVTGEAMVRAEPDEFIFHPSYQFNNADKTAALAALTAKSNEVVDALKKLGVAEKDIKTNANGYERQTLIAEPDSNGTNYTLQVTVTADDAAMAQKIQDYLASTSPVGSVSPQASFSESQQKSLENKARDEATKDARKKAEQTASNLGFRVGAVKSVTDSSDMRILPFETQSNGATDMKASAPKLTIQPGQNEFDYSVRVVYYIK